MTTNAALPQPHQIEFLKLLCRQLQMAEQRREYGPTRGPLLGPAPFVNRTYFRCPRNVKDPCDGVCITFFDDGVVTEQNYPAMRVGEIKQVDVNSVAMRLIRTFSDQERVVAALFASVQELARRPVINVTESRATKVCYERSLAGLENITSELDQLGALEEPPGRDATPAERIAALVTDYRDLLQRCEGLAAERAAAHKRLDKVNVPGGTLLQRINALLDSTS